MAITVKQLERQLKKQREAEIAAARAVDPALAERERRAEELGYAALAAGIVAPAVDPECMALIGACPPDPTHAHSLCILEAWSRGYNRALRKRLAEPIE